MKQFIAVILLCVAVVACNRVPEGVLDEQQLATVMVDLQYATALANEQIRANPDGDSLRAAILHSVFRRHGITPEQYDSTLRWYGHHMTRYIDACNIADSIISDSIRSIDRQILLARSRRGGGADTVNVWPHDPVHVFGPRLPQEYLTFNLTPDSIWAKGDIYILEFTPINARNGVTARLVVDYSDRRMTTEIIETVSAPGNDRVSLTLQTDSNKTVRRIYGFIYHPSDGDNTYIGDVALKRTSLNAEDYYRTRMPLHPIYGIPLRN
ncbi:MAG: DUF4296 domain-containing protein [Muribaculaceae bacterium]|nr:DUF4296 domain-containing protein [Muribaculaceae bacterium]